jgi:hypothetical protein
MDNMYQNHLFKHDLKLATTLIQKNMDVFLPKDAQVQHHDPFAGERDIEKGIYQYDPKANTCVDSDRGSQCTRPRMPNSLLCKYHYQEGHDVI